MSGQSGVTERRETDITKHPNGDDWALLALWRDPLPVAYHLGARTCSGASIMNRPEPPRR
jgi:hypothetical protein